jgi:Tannase-like family of unknown function (DUF6351)
MKCTISSMCRLLLSAAVLACSLPTSAAKVDSNYDIIVLSNRADLISGGDALVQVIVPPGIIQAIRNGNEKVQAFINGAPVPDGTLALRPDGRIYGLVTGFKVGKNLLTVMAPVNRRTSSSPTTPSADRFSPARNCNCGSGFPAALVYNPTTNPNGIRCGIVEQVAGVVGTFLDTDGVTKANPPRDNVGVQYGLKALRAWAANPADPAGITPEQFVQLNEGIGGFDADLVCTQAACRRIRLHCTPTTVVAS